MNAKRLGIVPMGMSLGVTFVIAYVLCVLYGMLGFQQGMHQLLFQIFPGFTWITWPSFFLGLFWSFVFGWYIAILRAVVFVPVFSLFAAWTQ
jgi:hypothetical protein